MIKFFIIFAVCVFGFFGYRVYQSGSVFNSTRALKTLSSPDLVTPAVGGDSVLPGQSNPVNDPGKLSHIVGGRGSVLSPAVSHFERFLIILWEEGKVTLVQTASDLYIFGRISSRGRVTYIDDYEVRGVDADGVGFHVINFAEKK